MKFISIFFSAVVLCIISSCGSSVDCNENAFVNDVNATISALNNAGSAWATDPTTANCNAYKKAASAYLDAVKDYKDCEELIQANYQQALESARATVNSITCT